MLCDTFQGSGNHGSLEDRLDEPLASASGLVDKQSVTLVPRAADAAAGGVGAPIALGAPVCLPAPAKARRGSDSDDGYAMGSLFDDEPTPVVTTRAASGYKPKAKCAAPLLLVICLLQYGNKMGCPSAERTACMRSSRKLRVALTCVCSSITSGVLPGIATVMLAVVKKVASPAAWSGLPLTHTTPPLPCRCSAHRIASHRRGSFFSVQEDAVNLRAGALPGAAGLGNLGNTCFMNSSLQCLSHALPIMRCFLTGAFNQARTEACHVCLVPSTSCCGSQSSASAFGTAGGVRAV